MIIIETQTEIQRLRPRDTHGDTQRHIETDMETKRGTQGGKERHIKHINNVIATAKVSTL